MNILIREASAEDALSIKDLSAQFGYELTAEETANNIQAIQNTPGSIIFIAVLDDKHIVGWVQVVICARLESGTFCEIAGIVVDEQYRGKGIGKQLVQQSIEWTRQKHISKLRVRTNIQRIKTHEFYSSIGFQPVKQQTVFELKV